MTADSQLVDLPLDVMTLALGLKYISDFAPPPGVEGLSFDGMSFAVASARPASLVVHESDIQYTSGRGMSV
jgi:hypothetical protein